MSALTVPALETIRAAVAWPPGELERMMYSLQGERTYAGPPARWPDVGARWPVWARPLALTALTVEPVGRRCRCRLCDYVGAPICRACAAALDAAAAHRWP